MLGGANLGQTEPDDQTTLRLSDYQSIYLPYQTIINNCHYHENNTGGRPAAWTVDIMNFGSLSLATYVVQLNLPCWP